MPIFKKRGPELIDLTQLQKKGTLQRSQKIAKDNSKNLSASEDIIDLTIKKSEISIPTIQPSPSQEMPNLGDFLSNLASSNSQSETSIPSAFLKSAISTHSLNLGKESSLDIQSLKIKLEDIEFKLDNFISRLNKIEEKIEKI